MEIIKTQTQALRQDIQHGALMTPAYLYALISLLMLISVGRHVW
jgi:hypothetical protein